MALLPLLMLLTAAAEMLSLGAIVPFLAILADLDQALQKPIVANVVEFLGWSGADDLRWRLTLVFAVLAILAGAARFLLLYATTRFNFGMGHELVAEMYRRTLYRPYEVHVARNSSETIGGLKKVDDVVIVVLGLLNTVSALVLAIVIVAVLVYIDPIVATVALAFFGIVYSVVAVFTRRQLASNGAAISAAVNARVQSIQEGLGGIRDVQLDHAQPYYLRRFQQFDVPLRRAQASSHIIGQGPRFAIESVGMVLIAVLATVLANRGGVVAAIPTLGALALGAQRLMPLLQQTYQGWVTFAANRSLVRDVAELLEQESVSEVRSDEGYLRFAREIRFEGVCYRYKPGFPFVIRDLSLQIPHGARVGIIGATGSGKSTAMDLLMGLLRPTSGRIVVDDTEVTGLARQAWQRCIAHVPQVVFLADASFAENIAFGVSPEDIDMDLVRDAAQGAQIASFIESCPDRYMTGVGERGVRLSGGQRQRVGIARALYRKARVLVFDEATSALDSATEEAVMEAIEGLGRDLTVVLIAHRVSTLRGCDVIYRVVEGGAQRVESFIKLVEGREGVFESNAQ